MRSQPLVSILCIVKNGVKTLRRCVESVLAQDYPRVELIVQDGASTDGTLDLLRQYGDRVNVVSEPDSSATDGMFRALRRARGDYVGFCSADDELLVHAVSWAVAQFRTFPELGAIHGEQYYTDMAGNITGQNNRPSFDFSRFIRFKCYPPMGAAFMKRSALEEIGLHDHEWRMDCGDTELWLRLAHRYPVRHFPEPVAKYALGEHEESMSPKFIHKLLGGTVRLFTDFFDTPGLPEVVRSMKDNSLGNLYLSFVEQFMTSDGHRKVMSSHEEIMKLFERALCHSPDYEDLERNTYDFLDYSLKMAESKALDEATRCLAFLQDARLPLARQSLLPKLISLVRDGRDRCMIDLTVAAILCSGNKLDKALARLARIGRLTTCDPMAPSCMMVIRNQLGKIR